MGTFVENINKLAGDITPEFVQLLTDAVAIDNMTVEVTALAVGETPTASWDANTGVLSLGIPTVPGPDGKTAYEVAVDEGYVGTAAQWLLTLVGPQGIQGIQGIQGNTGPQGIAGYMMLSGTVAPTTQGVDNDMYINTTTSDVYKKITGTWVFQSNIKGLTGATGATGAQGIQGIQGLTGNTGATGATGNGISTVIRTTGTGAPGTTDIYTITYTDTTTSTFSVYNGADGTGSGDMSKAVYDTNNSGVVDNAEKVNGLTVETAVPIGALFTDTTYTNVSELTNDAGYLTSETSYPADTLVAQDIINIGNLSGTNTGDQIISDATITLTDITTNNVSTTKHGFAPKLSNVATQYLNGIGGYTTPPDTIYTHPTTDGSLHVPANSTTNGGKVLTASATAGVYTWETPAATGVTSVTGTAPVVSSGGATPAISMAAATTSTNGYLTSTDWNTFANKQDTLVSGTNIKSINGTTILGSGDITTPTATINNTLTSTSTTEALSANMGKTLQDSKQANLVSGTNIKTINSTSLLGSGDVAVQPTLVSGTNIKTVNGSSLLGSGDIVAGGAWETISTTIVTTGVAQVEFLNPFNGTYKKYKIICSNIIASTQANIYFQLRSNGTYVTSYKQTTRKFYSHTASEAINNNLSATFLSVGEARDSTNTGYYSSLELEIDTSAALIGVYVNARDGQAGGGTAWEVFGCPNVNMTAPDGIKFYMSSGTIASGTFTLIGLK